MTISPTSVARAVGVNTQYKNLSGGRALFAPQHIAVFAQGASSVTYSSEKFQTTSAAEVGSKLGWGSPAHLIAQQLLAPGSSVPVTFFPLQDDASGVAAAGDITPSGTLTKAAAFKVRIGGVESASFTLAAGAMTVATVTAAITAAINGVVDMPVVAVDNSTVVDITAKWKGVSSNNMKIEILGDTSQGAAFAITQPTGGLVDPTVNTALTLMGSTWYTMCLNALDSHNATALDAFQVAGEAQWATLVHKPFMVFRGNTESSWQTATATTSGRTGDRVNVQLVAPGSPTLPCVVAAAQLLQIASMALVDPPHDYGSLWCRSIIPGAESVQWDYATRDAALKAGSSTVKIEDGSVKLSDTITSWAPVGEPTPAYRFVVDVVKLQQICFNISNGFNNSDWDGAPLITDADVTTSSSAKKPVMARVLVNNILDGLGGEAIITNVAASKKLTTANINGPKRLDVGIVVQLSGNTNQINVELGFGFYFG